ncbi:MAG: GTP-binding protein [Myxococcota bacterium]
MGEFREDRPHLPVSVTIIGGFLGVGKTTLLNYLLNHLPPRESSPRGGSRRVGVLVNDFGSINVDAALVVGVEGDLVQLSNGCICCSIRDDLVEGIERLLAVAEPPEHVIIEASGVSDPRRVAATIEQRMRRERISIDAVVIVVDADAYLQMGRRERIVAGGQLIAADILILNKADLVEASDLEVLEARVRRRAKRARVLRASHGRVPPALLLGVGAFDPARLSEGEPLDVHVHEVDGHHHHHHHHDHGAEFWTWSFRTERPLSARKLRRAVNELPASVVRAKGLVHLASHPKTRAVMHVVGRRAELCLDEPWGRRVPATGLVLIGAGAPLPPQHLEQLFRACEVEPGGSGSSGSIMRWMRRVLPPREAS